MSPPGHAGRPAAGAAPQFLGVLAVLVALWLGSTAPSVPPVAPPADAGLLVPAAAVSGPFDDGHGDDRADGGRDGRRGER